MRPARRSRVGALKRSWFFYSISSCSCRYGRESFVMIASHTRLHQPLPNAGVVATVQASTAIPHSWQLRTRSAPMTPCSGSPRRRPSARASRGSVAAAVGAGRTKPEGRKGANRLALGQGAAIGGIGEAAGDLGSELAQAKRAGLARASREASAPAGPCLRNRFDQWSLQPVLFRSIKSGPASGLASASSSTCSSVASSAFEVVAARPAVRAAASPRAAP